MTDEASAVTDRLIVRKAGAEDAHRVAALRRQWAVEWASQPLSDEGFEERFAEWYAAETTRRTVFLAWLDLKAVGMMNIAIFERMPIPGRAASRWGYLGNAFVLSDYRDDGVGTALLDAVMAHARARGCVRVVLSPTERSVPFYQRAGFGPATMLMVRNLGDQPVSERYVSDLS